jgi:hypothetical protein
MIRRGIFSNGLILKMPEPSLMTLPASHGKLADNRSRPLVNVLMIAECEQVSVTEKQQHRKEALPSCCLPPVTQA